MRRRTFIKQSGILAGGLIAAPTLFTSRRTRRSTDRGELIFKPYVVQKGEGPHLGVVKDLQKMGEDDYRFPQWAFASDEHWDTFYSNIFVTPQGVRVSDVRGKERFGINVRWNVEGFGFLYMTADNGGEFYTLPPAGATEVLNLNFELAKSRVMKNRERLRGFQGYVPSTEVQAFLDLSDEFLDAAARAAGEEEKGRQAQKSLYYAMWGGEMLELDKARKDIAGRREGFFLGCDTKGYPYMDRDLFIDLFTNVFNYATITHYPTTRFLPFEEREGVYNWALRDEQFRRLRDRGVTVEGRPIFWGDACCSPDWLIAKSYPELLKYLEKHTRDLVSHYGDEMYAWEVINEAHDFNNALGLTADQMVEIAGLICEVARDTNPNVHRLINNCCIQTDYIQLVDWSKFDEDLEIVTPHQFIKKCHEAGVDFTITGQQLYFPYTNRDLADNIRMTERLVQYGRPIQITEIGASSGPTAETIANGDLAMPELPYAWHRPWDEELQAEWLEDIYTIFYSKPWVEAINWYDFVDPYSFIKNGGLLASPKGEKKAAYKRLERLRREWV